MGRCAGKFGLLDITWLNTHELREAMVTCTRRVCKIKLVEIAAQMEEELKRPYPSQEAIGS